MQVRTRVKFPSFSGKQFKLTIFVYIYVLEISFLLDIYGGHIQFNLNVTVSNKIFTVSVAYLFEFPNIDFRRQPVCNITISKNECAPLWSNMERHLGTDGSEQVPEGSRRNTTDVYIEWPHRHRWWWLFFHSRKFSGEKLKLCHILTLISLCMPWAVFHTLFNISR